MGDFFALLFVVAALATAGNFAGQSSNLSGNCAGNYVRICW